jgi:hypothetical protein
MVAGARVAQDQFETANCKLKRTGSEIWQLKTERDPRSEKRRYQSLGTTLRHIWVALWYRRWVVDGYARHTIGARLLDPQIYASEISDPVLFSSRLRSRLTFSLQLTCEVEEPVVAAVFPARYFVADGAN